jgi:FkbM family methyltransferase
VAHLFAQLSERYAAYPALRLEQAAIGEADGAVVIHRVRTNPDASLWLQQLPSLSRELVEQNSRQLDREQPVIISETVPCYCVATLLERHHLTRLDFLAIDTEGWDWRILRQFDLVTLRPKLILYEHQHLATPEREQAHEFLIQHGYGWAETEEGDTLAWKLPGF